MFFTGWFLVGLVLAYYSRTFGVDWILWALYAGFAFLDLLILSHVLKCLGGIRDGGARSGCVLRTDVDLPTAVPPPKPWPQAGPKP